MNQEHYSVLEQEKLKFGIQVIVSECYKLLPIYLLAFLLDCVVSTLIIHSTFFLLRQVCLGYHFRNMYVCLIWSAIGFPIAAHYLADLSKNYSVIYLNIGTIILFLSVFILAPKGTENQPIINQRHRSYLRKKMIVRLLLLVAVLSFSSLTIRTFIVYGVFLETMMLILQILKEKIVNE